MDINEEINKLYDTKKHMPDLIIRKIKTSFFKYIYIVASASLCSDDKINEFILKFYSKKNSNIKITPAINYNKINKHEEIMFYILNGFTVVLSSQICMAFETRASIDRAIAESSSDPSVKGPKDSLNENYNMNLGLIRRRIKSEKLYLDEYYIGEKTKTKVGILYMNDIVSKDLVNEVKTKINTIKTDLILDSYYIKELIKKENNTLFPTIQSKEKPDALSLSLLEGKIVVLVENSPNALIIPTFFIDFFRNSEDYYQKPFYVSFARIIRLIAFFISILLPAFYIALTTIDEQILPTSLLINFASQREGVPFPSVIEALLLVITFEILYEGDARTPTSRGTSLSVLGALVLGDAAVNAGLVSPIMVIVVALSSISSLLFTYDDMQGAIRFWRYISMILSSFFGIIGFIVGFSLLLINLCSIKSFGKPYLIPIVPFYKKEALSDSIFKKSFKNLKIKKAYLTNKNGDNK